MSLIALTSTAHAENRKAWFTTDLSLTDDAGVAVAFVVLEGR